ncbi:hypothetical protein C0Q70_21096 [Pomacea canaliculata]|uniref:Uncharacterized protein n=1 Tax=Pomacea canaliculata TaxID=400727 RepID=A0A2T7NBJ3_POMCA|nr:hypothetical protein C0Q70_21096 [Pomacea canaliculata]
MNGHHTFANSRQSRSLRPYKRGHAVASKQFNHVKGRYTEAINTGDLWCDRYVITGKEPVPRSDGWPFGSRDSSGLTVDDEQSTSEEAVTREDSGNDCVSWGVGWRVAGGGRAGHGHTVLLTSSKQTPWRPQGR